MRTQLQMEVQVQARMPERMQARLPVPVLVQAQMPTLPKLQARMQIQTGLLMQTRRESVVRAPAPLLRPDFSLAPAAP